MIARISIKPHKITARTKTDLIRKIRNGCLCECITGAYYDYETRNYHFFNANKIRAKSRQTKKVTKTGKLVAKSEVIRNGHWEAFIYIVPINMVESCKQYSRNFTVSFKKNW